MFISHGQKNWAAARKMGVEAPRVFFRPAVARLHQGTVYRLYPHFLSGGVPSLP
jgi:hypothetical protein